MPSYTYQNIYDALQGELRKRRARLVDAQLIINRGARSVFSDPKMDLRSSKRRSSITPNLFNDVYAYGLPTDIKSDRICDIMPQVRRKFCDMWTLTSLEEFDRKKSSFYNLLAIDRKGGVNKLMISASVDDDQLVISDFESITDDGTWEGEGDVSDSSIEVDDFNYVKGNASLKFDINGVGGTTAGLKNESLDSFDITEFLTNGSVFAWVYISDTTDITNWTLRMGSDTSNYYYKAVTTTNEGTAFVNGWNLLRFDFSSMSENGTVDDDACTYISLYMTKAAGKINEQNYRLDWLVLKNGVIHDVPYYSRYPWQNTAGTWLLNSTASTDYINVEEDEFEMIMDKILELAWRELLGRKNEDYKGAKKDYIDKREEYIMHYPSEALVEQVSYYEF